MRIDARGTKRYFTLSEYERLALTDILSKFKYIRKSSSFSRYLETSVTPTLSIQLCDKSLLVVLQADKRYCLTCSRLIVSAIADMDINLEIGTGALKVLGQHTDIFRRLQFHKCI